MIIFKSLLPEMWEYRVVILVTHAYFPSILEFATDIMQFLYLKSKTINLMCSIQNLKYKCEQKPSSLMENLKSAIFCARETYVPLCVFSFKYCFLGINSHHAFIYKYLSVQMAT